MDSVVVVIVLLQASTKASIVQIQRHSTFLNRILISDVERDGQKNSSSRLNNIQYC